MNACENVRLPITVFGGHPKDQMKGKKQHLYSCSACDVLISVHCSA